MSKNFRLDDLLKTVKKKDKKVRRFTHTINTDGDVVEENFLAQDWSNVMLLNGKREDLFQFLVWDNCTMEYYILLSEDEGIGF